MQHATLPRLLEMKAAGEKIAMLTAYDATWARLLNNAGIDALLVGDSLGMVVQGAADTLSVKLSQVVYHARCARAGAPKAVIIGDMPFGSFQTSPKRAFENAARLMAAGATAVKIEGGAIMAATVEFLTSRGIPVCAHVGLMPQWVRAQGGYRVQGQGEDEKRVKTDAQIMQDAGASMMILELIPASLAKSITEQLVIPTIGIGSGKDCDGQVLVLYDMLGLGAGNKKIVKNFMIDSSGIQEAIIRYAREVKAGEFPAAEHIF